MNFQKIPSLPNKLESEKVLSDTLEISDNELESLVQNDFEKKTNLKKGSANKANQTREARQTLENMNGQATTLENERKVREARGVLGEAVDDLPDDVKKAVDEGQEKDSILNDQVADGRLNLNQVENRIVEFETHQRVELHHAIENQLRAKLIPALIGFGIRNMSDLQLALNCDSRADLVSTCEKILKAASSQTDRSFKTADIRKSIGNLDELENILIAGFRLHKEDPDFKLEQFRIDPEAAVRMVRVDREMAE